jgi:GNAT superfamily N-acetyltransferase
MIMQKTQYTIRTFNPATDAYAAIVAVYNQANEFEKGSAASWQHWDKNRAPERLFRRYVVEQAGKIIGYGFSMKPDTAVNRFHLAIHLPPQYQTEGLIGDFYTYIIDNCRQHGAVGFTTKVRDGAALKMDWLTQNGFQPVMRYPLSTLNVPAFDSAPYAGLFDKMAEQGIEITSLAELSLRDADWQKRVYDLDVIISEDVPSPHPYTHAPFHLYAQREFENPQFAPEDWFVAVIDGQYVGMTVFEKVGEDTEMLQTSFTGVFKTYRRRGIALALKVRSIQYAQSLGTRLIIANNEENNPMYQINLALGFQLQPADADWERNEEMTT